MPPKLSAALNNCALHAFVPTIKNQINEFANNSTLSAHKEQYEILKDAFAKFYLLDTNDFSFKQFSQLLNKYNAHDSQIILGPVLREYMQSTAAEYRKANTEGFEHLALVAEKNNETYIKSRTEISGGGRFESLSPEEAFLFIGKPLGVNVSYGSGATLHKLGEENDFTASIEMHHRGEINSGHWELSPKNSEIDGSAAKKSQFEDITNLFREGSADLSQWGLSLLKKHVHLTAKESTAILTQLNNKAQELANPLTPVPPPPHHIKLQSELKEEILANGLINSLVNKQKQLNSGTEITAHYKTELVKLFSERDNIQDKATNASNKAVNALLNGTVTDPSDALSDEEYAATLQNEEFINAGFKP